MIDALDHLTLRASFRDGAVGAYETLLGRQAEDGRLRVGNVGVTIEDHASTAQLSSMVFATASLDKAARLLERRAVPSERDGDRLMLSTEATHRVPIALVERTDAPQPSPLLKSSEAASITALDHVVIRTPNPERAVALYAGRLGLDLRLDRSNPEWGSRLLFFRCGDLVVEIAHDLKKGVSDGARPALGPVVAHARYRALQRAAEEGGRRGLRAAQRAPAGLAGLLACRATPPTSPPS